MPNRLTKPGAQPRRYTSRQSFAATLLACLPTLLFAQQSSVPGSMALATEEEPVLRRYAVELIIFEYTDRSSAGTESFLPDPVPDLYGTGTADPMSAGFPATDDPDVSDPLRLPNAIDPTINRTTDPAIEEQTNQETLAELPTIEQLDLRMLPESDYVLGEVYSKLQRLDAYQPVIHTAWTQLTLEKDATLPIDLKRLGNPPLRLNGSFTLYLSRFLHLVVDLALEEKSPLRGPPARERVPLPGSERVDERSDGRFGNRRGYGLDPEFAPQTVYYRINEDRIVRNGELRYYDHPRFGVVAKISRVEETADDSGTPANR